jgi:hypothetical protein
MIFRKSTYLQMKVLASTVNFCDREDVYFGICPIERARLASGRWHGKQECRGRQPSGAPRLGKQEP